LSRSDAISKTDPLSHYHHPSVTTVGIVLVSERYRRRKRQMKRENVLKLRRQQRQRKRHEVARKQQQPTPKSEPWSSPQASIIDIL
jgi:hypothetical protein